jgi:O-acetyl-ADP-ribose deacetylase
MFTVVRYSVIVSPSTTPLIVTTSIPWMSRTVFAASVTAAWAAWAKLSGEVPTIVITFAIFVPAMSLLSWGRRSHTPQAPAIVEAVKLEVVEGDITALEVDAVANAANDRLWMGSGVAGAIKRAGGEEIEREAVARGPIPLGEAVATGAGRLAARWVLHGAVMGQDLRTDEALVRRATESCLILADELGAESLALPAFGTGVGGFPLDECARIMVEAARAHEPLSLRRVIFAVFGDDARAAFETALGSAA